MKKLNSLRRGSALLIVLGMMAFIVVSAVAFAAYMRYSRLPSSYLRRTSASRLLAKAALAEAIDSIDRAIGNNPYPGVGNTSYRQNGSLSQKRDTETSRLCNHWEDRVFIGTTATVSPEDTISTLTLEGLAYIPAPFINEARYWSRRSPAAEWHTMGFDAGRYAFSAIDVSDCFDVNRLVADAPRDSSDENRITLSHCFEKHTSDSSSGDDYVLTPDKWDDFMSNYVDENHSKVPLVSVADLNLALADRLGGDIAKKLSPFYNYITQNNNARFVKNSENEDAAMMRNLCFVTDSYFPSTNRVNGINLANAAHQPFYGFSVMSQDDPKKNDDTLDRVLNDGSSTFLNRFVNELQGPEVVQLYDYLDRDAVPLSLALPTVERTPMVTGVSLEGNLKVEIKTTCDEEIQGEKNPQTGEVLSYYQVKAANLSIKSDMFKVMTGLVFPFKYDRGTQPSFYAQAGATIVIVRESEEVKSLRRKDAKAPAVITKDAWNGSAQKAASAKFGDEVAPVIITMQSAKKKITYPKDIENEEDAVLEDFELDLDSFNVELVGDMPAAPNGLTLPDKANKGSFRLIQKLDKSKQPIGEPNLASTIRPVALDLSRVLAGMENGETYVPVVQVWVRILDENENVVDLVPACAADDATPSQILGDIALGSKERPLLRFYHQGGGADGSPAFGLTKEIFDNYGERELSIHPKAYVADDPRFNYAPENFVALSSIDKTFKDYWLENNRSQSRDGDIFMTTSDAGYLQSAYELTALLDICGLRGSGDMTPINSSGYNGSARTSFSETPANRAMWTTYSQFAHNSHRDQISPLGIENGTRGFRINPYTGDVNVMLAALANTPLNWWAASTNDLADAWGNTKSKMLDDLKEANKYTFSKHSGAMVEFEHGKVQDTPKEGTLVELAKKMMTHFRHTDTDRGWEDAFDHEINWTQEDLIDDVDFGVTLHSVDKKFLHGYWRECFANRQQLFLIFVRAEPMMLGGGGLGQTPPQLGARAVALVWRDPRSTGNDDEGVPKPHRTRLLFYRQFD